MTAVDELYDILCRSLDDQELEGSALIKASLKLYHTALIAYFKALQLDVGLKEAVEEVFKLQSWCMSIHNNVIKKHCDPEKLRPVLEGICDEQIGVLTSIFMDEEPEKPTRH